ncbi:hypothetical protein PCANC_11411 [Puccinia coronata f. sp. avenae]|uniref:Uncharacterized protein n=1 Tax=Puccinia coronata f. sp. avenae TaxID=200324 RepID=A0A2N5VME6_9BASI|nr:hypothetical protein PCANC_11411 [Puccinia coronata f. sp. avenae]
MDGLVPIVQRALHQGCVQRTLLKRLLDAFTKKRPADERVFEKPAPWCRSQPPSFDNTWSTLSAAEDPARQMMMSEHPNMGTTVAHGGVLYQAFYPVLVPIGVVDASRNRLQAMEMWLG